MDRPHRSVHVGVVHFWQQAAVGVLDEVSLDHADRLEVGEVAVVPQLDGGGGEGGGGDGGDGGGRGDCTQERRSEKARDRGR